MKWRYKILLLAATLLCGLSVCAQDVVRVVEDESKTRTASLSGKAQAVFVSSSKDLFIETSNPSLDKHKSTRKNSAGLWEYVIELQLQTQEGSAVSRTFTITQSGSANKTRFKKGKFESNKRYYFRVEPVKNPIFLVDNTQPTDAHLKNGEASVEINSLIEIEVEVNPLLSCKVEKSYTTARFYSTLVVINMNDFEQLRNDVRRHQINYEDLNESLLERAENQMEVRESEWYSLQMLQQKKEEAEEQFADISTIRITAKDSNELSIDISDLQTKHKKVYTVESSNRPTARSKTKGRWILLGDYAFSNSFRHSFGVTVAWVSRFGGYASVMSNGHFDFQTYRSFTIDEPSLQSENYLWTGETSVTRFSVTAGAVVALSKLGYVYAGAGYGIRNLVWYTVSDYAVIINPGSFKGLVLEAGAKYNLNENLLLSMGATAQISNSCYELKLGFGYRF